MGRIVTRRIKSLCELRGKTVLFRHIFVKINNLDNNCISHRTTMILSGRTKMKRK